MLQNPHDLIVAYAEEPEKLAPYQIRVPVYEDYYATIRIDPCRYRNSDICCNGMNEGACDDNQLISAGPNLAVAWSYNNFLVQCTGIFESFAECGTFLEIHRPGSTKVLSQQRLVQTYTSGFDTAFLFTKHLCAGIYEV